MTNFIPIYPLETVIYPEETIRLTITGHKYIQLINDCFEDQKELGIQVILDGKMMEYGTLIEINELERHQEEHYINIKAKGLQVFRILETIHDIPEKKYSGAIVSYPENDKMKVHPNLSRLIIDEVKNLFEKLNIENVLPSEMQDWSSYEIAHKLGLTKEQEYELLSIFNEVQRMEFLRRYMNGIMPEVDDIELIKSRINLN
jgi:Lon protease-like protein